MLCLVWRLFQDFVNPNSKKPDNPDDGQYLILLQDRLCAFFRASITWLDFFVEFIKSWACLKILKILVGCNLNTGRLRIDMTIFCNQNMYPMNCSCRYPLAQNRVWRRSKLVDLNRRFSRRSHPYDGIGFSIDRFPQSTMPSYYCGIDNHSYNVQG